MTDPQPTLHHSSTVLVSNPALEKLLQRLARQFASHGSSTNNERTKTKTGSDNDVNNTQYSRPPDVAAAALGRELAQVITLSTQDLIWRALVRANYVPSSIPHAFFQYICQQRLVPGGDLWVATTSAGGSIRTAFAWIPTWLVQTEQLLIQQGKERSEANPSLQHLLQACIPAYATYIVLVSKQEMSTEQPSAHKHQKNRRQQEQLHQYLLVTLGQLRLEATKLAVSQAILQGVLRRQATNKEHWNTPGKRPTPNTTTATLLTSLQTILSPLLVDCVVVGGIQHSQHSESYNSLSIRSLQLLCRNIRALRPKPSHHGPLKLSAHDVCCIVDWMTTALQLYLDIYLNNNNNSINDSFDRRHLAEQWFGELLVMIQELLDKRQTYRETKDNEIVEFCGTWIRNALYKILPRLIVSTTQYGNNVTDILSLLGDTVEQFAAVVQQDDEDRTDWIVVDAPLAFRLSILILASGNPHERQELFRVLHCSQVVHMADEVALALLQIMTCICVHDVDCNKDALLLFKQLQCTPLSGRRRFQNANETPIHHLVQVVVRLLDQPTRRGKQNRMSLIQAITDKCDFSRVNLSTLQQVSALVFGIVLLDDEKDQERAFRYLSNLMDCYPYLAISLMPTILDLINQVSNKGDAQKLLRYMNFLCTSMIKDPHCAQEVWNIVGIRMMDQFVPLSIRVTVIRLLPTICNANKRLYRRVIETLGSCVNSREPELRLACAATLADLARADQIRDVSDVIGWLQDLLTEELITPIHSLLVHYSLLSLHYLVIAEELDFDVVVKVLNKRLCPISDFEALLRLPEVVQEALVILLGDGECESEDSSQEEEDSGEPAAKSTSPLALAAIRTLIRLGASFQDSEILTPTQERILQNIYSSLAGYTNEALGLVDEGVKNAVAFANTDGEHPGVCIETERYIALRNLVVSGISTQYVKCEGEKTAPSVVLATKLLQFEEEVLGSSLWQKHGRGKDFRSPATGRFSKQTPQSVLPKQSKVHKLANRRKSVGAAIAMIFVSDGSQLSVIRDNGDAALDNSDSLFEVLSLQAYLHFAVCLASRTRREDFSQIVNEIKSWHEVYLSPDAMYFILSTLVTYIPVDIPDSEHSTLTLVESIYETIFDAFNNSRFEKDSLARICLGLVGVSSVRSGSLVRAIEVCTVLEQSVRGHGGQQVCDFYGTKFFETQVVIPESNLYECP